MAVMIAFVLLRVSMLQCIARGMPLDGVEIIEIIEVNCACLATITYLPCNKCAINVQRFKNPEPLYTDM